MVWLTSRSRKARIDQYALGPLVATRATGEGPVEKDAALIVSIHNLKTRELRSEIEEAGSGSRHEQV